MALCFVCSLSAEANTPAGRVCRKHAEEFYRGLVAEAIRRDRPVAESDAIMDVPVFRGGPPPIPIRNCRTCGGPFVSMLRGCYCSDCWADVIRRGWYAKAAKALKVAV